MKTLHIFTEELSAKKCFENIRTNFFPSHNFEIHPHSSREELKKRLPKVIPSLSKTNDVRILITIDQDKNNCKKLKTELEKIVQEKCLCPYKIRIVCKELESWFFGDLEAVTKAYPRFNSTLHRNKTKMKNVDEIEQPNKEFLKIIPDFKNINRLPKVEFAERVSAHLSLDHNTSLSFQNTINAIKFLIK